MVENHKLFFFSFTSLACRARLCVKTKSICNYFCSNASLSTSESIQPRKNMNEKKKNFSNTYVMSDIFLDIKIASITFVSHKNHFAS